MGGMAPDLDDHPIMPATADQVERLEADHRLWRDTLFEPYLTDPGGRIVGPAPHHTDLWDWLWSIRRGTRPHPFVAIWGRGGAKSTNAELGATALGVTERRRYGLYVCRTQARADDHVGSIASMLETAALRTFYPLHGDRRISRFGSSKGWRRNRLRTAGGFTVDALGLDTAARGTKLDEDRPDLLIFDDIDGTHDSATITAKIRDTIMKDIIPAGAEDRAILAIQNLVHPTSIFAELAGLTDQPADWLHDRIVSGPIPAVADLTYAWKDGRVTITGGTPTWIGYDLDRAQAEIDDIGISAFLEEAQHEVQTPPGGIFDHLELAALRIRLQDIPPLVRIVVWVDPAITKTDQSDCHAIQCDGLATDGRIYRLSSWEQRATPVESITRAIRTAVYWKAEKVGIETDQGGDTWKSVWYQAVEAVLADTKNPLNPEDRLFVKRLHQGEAKAGQGEGPKVHRAQQMLAAYETDQIRHVLGTHLTLEAALRRFPKTKPLDLVDCAYWSWTDLDPTRGPVGGARNDDPAAIKAALTAERHSTWR